MTARHNPAPRAARWKSALLIVLPIVAVVVIAATAAIREARRPLPGVAYPIVGREHVPDGTVVDPAKYNSNPPTSGPHWQDPKKPGIYATPIPDSQAIHNLEHSHIWISYRDPTDTTAIERLTAIANRHPGIMLLSPRPKDDAPIAVAAWGHLLNLNRVDEAQIEAFIAAYQHAGPEDLPNMGV